MLIVVAQTTFVLALITAINRASVGAAMVTAVAALVGGASLVWEYKRDVFEFWSAVAWLMTLAAGFAALPFAVDGPTENLAIAIFVAIAALAAIAWWRRWATQQVPSRWPNILVQHVAKKSIHELGGVQLAVTAETIEARAQVPVSICVWLQNCWDVGREVDISMTAEMRLSLNRKGICLPAPVRIVLGAGEVCQVWVVCVPEAGAEGKHPVAVHIGVNGKGGVRARHERAPAYQGSISPWLQLAALFGGVIVTGGGGHKLTLRVSPEELGGRSFAPEVRKESLWLPSA